MTENLNGNIEVKGAREHNLKNISVVIPRNKLTVITGLSGSGKSSLAFDIIYAEGQRRYLEGLSSYARNYMVQLKKPEVESVVGLSPSIAIDQKTITTNPRSTVGTVTEIYDYLRLLFARVGVPHCPEHNQPVSSQTPADIIKDIMSQKKGDKFCVLAPVYRGKKGEFLREFQKWEKNGFTQAKVDGQWVQLSEAKKLAKHKFHDIDLLVDRLVVDKKFESRLQESVNLALNLSQGLIEIENVTRKTNKLYSIHRSCPECGFTFPELEPRIFSFNSPKGACQDCNGLGYLTDNEDEFDEGEGDDYVEYQICSSCDGQKLSPRALSVFLNKKNISEFSRLTARQLLEEFHKMKLPKKQTLIAEKIIEQINSRLEYMLKVGTSYLSLDRETRTLSGGEVQRIRLATQVGSSLVGVLYVLDEPSIGLHPRDHHRLLGVINEIKDRGNTIILVEHDEDTIRSADHIIDLGPGAGKKGGEVMADGDFASILKSGKGLTADYLTGKMSIPTPKSRRSGNGLSIDLKGASGHNLNRASVKIPLGQLIGVTGVSGSGKSTLIIGTLFPELWNRINKTNRLVAEHEEVVGVENIDKVIEINQKPIGRTPRSTPSTYVGVFPAVRQLFAELPEAQIRGFKAGHFSFNVKGGRCEECQGAGVKKIEMHFLSDVYVPCDTCQGKRFGNEALSIRYKNKNISEVLNMTVNEACDFFKHHKKIFKKLETLRRVGMGYMTLGQNSTTLSGGEAQRVKLSRELSKTQTGKTLYILDEPTTGLHFEDVNKLTSLLQELVDQGNTVIVIEHHLDVIKNCDHIIDMGPDGGVDGGDVVFTGTPEMLMKNKSSFTGQFLKKHMKNQSLAGQK